MMPTEPIDRRDFLKGTLLPAAALPLIASGAVRVAAAQETKAATGTALPNIVDTNVHLFEWPFRTLKYARTPALIARLKKHRITQAWAGNFEAVLHKNFDLSNARLAEECRDRGEGMFLPFGSVNPIWPDWEETLRRCHETYRMPGIRLYPNYHGYALDRPEFLELLDRATQRGMLVQIAIEMEDKRVHHPLTNVPPVEGGPLVDALKRVPKARIQLINGWTAIRSGLISNTNVVFDVSNIEGTMALGKLIEGKLASARTQVPVTRLLFGSHAPYFPCEAGLLRLFEPPLERDQMVAIMNGNAKTLLAPA